MSIIRNRTTEGKENSRCIQEKSRFNSQHYNMCLLANAEKAFNGIWDGRQVPKFKTPMLRTFICHLPKAEYSFILLVKIHWVPFCLPRAAHDCQGSMAHTKVTPKLEYSSEITHAFVQVPQGLWGNRHCQSMLASSNAGSASAFYPMTSEHEMCARTLEAPWQTYSSPPENSLLVSRGLPQRTV